MLKQNTDKYFPGRKKFKPAGKRRSVSIHTLFHCVLYVSCCSVCTFSVKQVYYTLEMNLLVLLITLFPFFVKTFFMQFLQVMPHHLFYHMKVCARSKYFSLFFSWSRKDAKLVRSYLIDGINKYFMCIMYVYSQRVSFVKTF